MPDLLNGMAVLEAWHQEDPAGRYYAVDRVRIVSRGSPARSGWMVTLELPYRGLEPIRGRGDTLPEAVQDALDEFNREVPNG